MKKLKSQSLFGNSFCYIKFEKESFNKNKNNEEIILRWSQFLSLLPFASINSDMLPIPLFTKNLRYIFSLYIYLYFLVIATEGSTYYRPLYYDLKSNKINEDIISKRYEAMLGSNILIEPIFQENITNLTTLFPEDKFYDFYNGNYINNIGEGYYNIFFDKNKLPIYLRGGKITPVQLLDEYYDIYINNNILNNKNIYEFYTDEILSMEKMKEKPIQLLIALDNNMQAQGRILLDDFDTNDSKKKKYFYKMLITVSQRTNDISIFFRVFSLKYILHRDLFKNSINRLIIYGFNKLTVKKITIMNKNGRVEFDRRKLIFSQASDLLTIPNINIPLNMDTKILII
jgi:alpha-glucosidase (family GH31 glycosyl hydrolase)